MQESPADNEAGLAEFPMRPPRKPNAGFMHLHDRTAETARYGRAAKFRGFCAGIEP
jgi:hypothetical protein